jgi:hypothetical protein
MGKFDALAEFRNKDAVTKGREPASTETEATQVSIPAKSPTKGPGPGRPIGKRSNPDYEQLTILIRKHTKKRAVRLLEDTAADQDFSELIEHLLSQWVLDQA